MNRNTEPSEESPERALFREPPPLITGGCAAYMDRISELREFVSTFFSVVKAFGPLVKALEAQSPQQLADIGKETQPARYYFSGHRQFVNELLLSRAVESFELYVLTILRSIFRVRPEMLKSEASIDVATIVELGSSENILTYVAERRLHELSFKPLSDLSKFIESRTGINLFATPDVFETVLLASEVRNLIAHNDCVVNDVFRRRVGAAFPADSISDAGKFLITDRWVRTASYVLDGVVFDFDVQAGSKFSIPTVSSTGFKGTRIGATSPPADAVRPPDDQSEV